MRSFRYGLLVCAILIPAAFAGNNAPLENRTGKMNKFPCSECHKSLKQEKTGHHELAFRHMKHEKKCLLCHSGSHPNELVMLDGRRISLNEAPRLCGQCHGPVYIDWQEGLHGKRFGKGTKSDIVLSCTSCHEPHSPKFKKMKADPAPKRPRFENKGSHGREE